MRNYEEFSKWLKINSFLKKHFPKKSRRYRELREQVFKDEEREEHSLYQTAEGFYNLFHSRDVFYSLERDLLNKEGISPEDGKKVICGAVICSLLDFLSESKTDYTSLLENTVGIEPAVYLMANHENI
jgi:hypothetical protein